MRQKFLGSLQKEGRGRIGRGHRGERLGASRKVAAAPTRQCMRIGGRYNFLLRSFFAMIGKRFVNAHRFLAALDADAVKLRQAKLVDARSNVLLAAMIVVPKYLLAPSSRDATFTASPMTVELKRCREPILPTSASR